MVKGLWNKWNKKALQMIWRIKKDRQVSFLVGTAHWFPFSFQASFRSLFRRVGTTIFEGPLDEISMQMVAHHGKLEGGDKILDGLVTPDSISLLNKHLRKRLIEKSDGDISVLMQTASVDVYTSLIENSRPWMAFFSIWPLYLGWDYSVDLEAYQLAQKMGKEIIVLETIEEQLQVLDGIPLERFVGHLNDVENWSVYQKKYQDAYLAGDLDGLLGLSSHFPTRTPVVLSQRDQLLFERMRTVFDTKPAAAFVGLSHIPGISKLFIEEGYQIEKGLE